MTGLGRGNRPTQKPAPTAANNSALQAGGHTGCRDAGYEPQRSPRIHRDLCFPKARRSIGDAPSFLTTVRVSPAPQTVALGKEALSGSLSESLSRHGVRGNNSSLVAQRVHHQGVMGSVRVPASSETIPNFPFAWACRIRPGKTPFAESDGLLAVSRSTPEGRSLAGNKRRIYYLGKFSVLTGCLTSGAHTRLGPRVLTRGHSKDIV
jgi:hypothetical protein